MSMAVIGPQLSRIPLCQRRFWNEIAKIYLLQQTCD